MYSYNLSKVVSLRVIKKSSAVWWEWKPAGSKFFGLIKTKEGFYYHWSFDDNGWNEKCPADMYLEDGKVYENPRVIMWFADGKSRSFYFDTVDEAIAAAKNIKKRSSCEWYELEK